MLKQEIALITGASRGIGLAITLELGRQGAYIVGTATSGDGAQSIAKILKENGIAGEGAALNVAEPDSVNALMEHMERNRGMPSILVNNAGITRDGLVLRMSDSDWENVLTTNLTSVYRMTKACLRAMTKARKGRIISITSVVATVGNAGQTNYAAAKAGIAGFTRALAREVASREITVNAVAPGFIDTDMTRALPEAQRQALLEQIPLGRLGLAEEVAFAVAFLASPRASYITGLTLHVNGGMHMN